jgi:hypothetical protein
MKRPAPGFILLTDERGETEDVEYKPEKDEIHIQVVNTSKVAPKHDLFLFKVVMKTV